MKEELITFETAILAKEKGFNNKSQKGYYKHGDINLLLWIDSENYNNQKDFLCEAPTQSLLQKWLREVHGIDVLIQKSPNGRDYDWYLDDNDGHFEEASEAYQTYEEALEQGLQEALKLISC